jgi:hypothetical protein
MVMAAWTLDNPQELNFSQCSARVDNSRGSLFQPDIYLKQFNFTTWYSSNLTTDEALCGEGFEDNSDIYGLGIRVGIYLQWVSCLLANHTLPETRVELAQAYLLFLIAICVTALVMSIQNTCNFALEIIILYYMFFGGKLCVFTWPNLTTPKSKIKWLGMTWYRTILSILDIFMIGHGAWFWLRGYDTRFARLPCGTHHFFFVKISDPGDFGLLRFFLATNFLSGLIEVGFIKLAFTILFIREIVRSVRESDIYRGLFPRSRYSQIEQRQNSNASPYFKIFEPISAFHSRVHAKYASFVARFLGIFVEAMQLKGNQKRHVELETAITEFDLLINCSIDLIEH